MPVEPAFTGVANLLKPRGVLLLTVPYQIDTGTIEHFPNLHEYTVTCIGSSYVLVNRTKYGVYEVFDKLASHGGIGTTLEMRIFGEPDLMRRHPASSRSLYKGKITHLSESSSKSVGVCRFSHASNGFRLKK